MDTRELLTFEKKLGMYDLAGAIYSDGDVIDFVDGVNPGIIIADTCGHKKEFGDKAREFLQKEIRTGWGSQYDIKTEILELGRKLMITGTGKPSLEGRFNEREEWWDCIACSYAQFTDEGIYLTGIHNLIARENGTVETPWSILGPYHFDDPGEREPVRTVLSHGDIMLIASDGLENNIRIISYLKGENHEQDTFETKLGRILNQNKTKEISSIRDILISQLKYYFMSGMIKCIDQMIYDDVTFVLVKKA